MNLWKPIALTSMVVSLFTVGYHAASANPEPGPRPGVGVNQPHMQNALAALQTAQTELGLAEHNKGGWRAKALIDITPVLADVNNGIAAGNQP
jgi:hypothetical protein